MNTSSDLDSFVDADEIDLVMTNPRTGDPVIASDEKPWTIKLAGPNHPESVKLRNAAIGKTLKRNRTRGNVEQSPDEVVNQSIDHLVARTLGWNAPLMGGQPVPFSKEAARKIYTTMQAFRNQVQERLVDDAGFLKSSESK